MHASKKAAVPRPLTSHERVVTRWAIEHGAGEAEAKARYLAQLDRATVIGECQCGCASLEFAVDGRAAHGKGREILGDFATMDREYGLCVFASQGQLDGVEVFQMAACRPCATLPSPDVLTAW